MGVFAMRVFASLRPRRLLVAAFSCALLLLGCVVSASAQTAQVTSERSCKHDSDCPHHDGCWFDWWPGCGCNEGAKHCDPNPAPCDSASGCFGREVCSSEGRCIEPGPPIGTPCNTDGDCADWMSCLEGRCSLGNCVLNSDCHENFECERNECVQVSCSRDSDCHGGQVCRDRSCVTVQCVSDSECGSRAVCDSGRCRGVECRNAGQCPSCSLCDAANSCVSLCREGEECFGFPSAERGQFVVHLCKDPGSLTCTSRASCPLGQLCLGGSCIDLKPLLRDLDLRARERP